MRRERAIRITNEKLLELLKEVNYPIPPDTEVRGVSYEPTRGISRILISSIEYEPLIEGSETPDVVLLERQRPEARFPVDQERALATILAALRCYQQDGGFEDIATNDGAFEALSNDEIDDLCETFNRDLCETLKRLGIELPGGRT